VARIVKLPDDLELWRDMAREGLLWEEATGYDYLTPLPSDLLILLEEHDTDTLARLRWTSRHFRIGIMLEE